MISELEKKEIYLYDNFFEDYHIIYDFLVKNYKKHTPVYQDDGEIFFNVDSGFPEEWLILLGKIKNIIFEKYGSLCATKSNSLSSVIYEDGSHKVSHRDNFHIFIDQNGVKIEEKFNYTSIFYLNNNFTGGKLSFDLLNLFVDPVPGRLLVFPSDLLHSVSKVSNGTRFVVSKFWRVEE
jgi:hypothetical protein